MAFRWATCTLHSSTLNRTSVHLGLYQRVMRAYRDPDRRHERQLMTGLIESVGPGVPAALRQIHRLGRTLSQRAADVQTTSTDPAPVADHEAARSGLSNLRGITSGF